MHKMQNGERKEEERKETGDRCERRNRTMKRKTKQRGKDKEQRGMKKDRYENWKKPTMKENNGREQGKRKKLDTNEEKSQTIRT